MHFDDFNQRDWAFDKPPMRRREAFFERCLPTLPYTLMYCPFRPAITLGGRQFGTTSNGVLPAPVAQTVAASSGTFSALLTGRC